MTMSSWGLRRSAKRLCVEAPGPRYLSVSLGLRASSPPLPKNRDNRPTRDRPQENLPVLRTSDVQLTGGDFREGGTTAVALRKFWQTHFAGATFQNKEEFTKWYLKNSVIFVIVMGGFMAWHRYTESRPPVVMGPDHFVKFKVISRTRIAPDTLLIQLDLPRDALPPVDSDSPAAPGRPIQSVYVADSDSMIQRPYTPLSADVFDPLSPRNTGKLSLLVKRYEAGEVSKWLHSRAIGAEVPIRGPVSTWDVGSRAADDLVFIVAGTGITPAFQMISSIYDPPELGKEQSELLWGKKPNSRVEAQEQALQEVAVAHLSWTERFKLKVASIREARDFPPSPPVPHLTNSPRITVLFASPSTDSILLRQSLEAYANKYPGQIRVAFWADALADPSHTDRVVKVGRIGLKDLASHGGKADTYSDPARATVLVCGPDGFVEAMAGPWSGKGSRSAIQSDPLGGLLQELGWKSDQVVRLDSGQHLAQRIA